MSDTRAITDFMKAVTIFLVVVLHFIGHIGVQGATAVQGILVVFFFLSGYGMYHSLSRYDGIDIRAVVHFFAKRFLRIYPLFWIAVLIVMVLGVVIDVGGFFTDVGATMLSAPIAQFLAVPFLHPTFFKWFVPFLIQCYLLSPVLYLVLEHDLRVYFTSLLGGLGVLNAVLFGMGYVPVFRWTPAAELLGGGASYLYPFIYIFFGHIAYFGLGMATPRVLERLEMDRSPFPWLFLSIVFILLTAGPSKLFEGSHRLFSAALIVTLPVALALVIQRNYSHPLIERFRPLGRHSYAIYLFHMFVIRGMGYLGLLRSPVVGALILVLLSPLFYAFIVILERAVGRVVPDVS